jgi:hypothetical protein
MLKFIVPVSVLAAIMISCGSATLPPTTNTGTPNPGTTPTNPTPITSDPYAGILPKAIGSATVTFSEWGPEWPASIPSETFQPDTIRASQIQGTVLAMYADGQYLRCFTQTRAKSGLVFAAGDFTSKATYTQDEYLDLYSGIGVNCQFSSMGPSRLNISPSYPIRGISELSGYTLIPCGGSMTFSSVTTTAMTYSYKGKFCFAKLKNTAPAPPATTPYTYSFTDVRPAVTLQFSGSVDNVLVGIFL